MLGSIFDADDAVQEALVRAWKSAADLHDQRALHAWLYRIATNVCIDMLAERKRRARPFERGPAGTVGSPLDARPADEWIEPALDALVLSEHGDPHERAVLRERTRLAFVTALQQLPPKQRAALLLTEVLGFTAIEAADCLSLSVAAINSAVQRARARLDEGARGKGAIDEAQRAMLERYVQAFEAFDVEAMVALLHEDARLSMPPLSLWIEGPAEIARWLRGPGAHCKGSRLVPIEACGSPAFAQYRPSEGGGFHAWCVIVLELDDARIAGWNAFLAVDKLFPRFGLPLTIAR
jgi:RNA polymerase sigma-70 factor (ECF subfamily)